MAKNKALTWTYYVNGEKVDKLTDEQCDRICEMLSEAMSRYYAAHPDEFKKLQF